MTFRQAITRYPHRFIVLALLVVSSLASTSILFVRWSIVGYPARFWLTWDLFLAWVPFAIAVGMHAYHVRGCGNRVMVMMGMAWLLFFPNAPYLLTEFVHLGRRHSGVWWYDLMMTIGFAFNGLVLGLLSLLIVQRVVRERLGTRWAMGTVAMSLALGSLGVSLGRFQRFNSWDILSRPRYLLGNLLYDIHHPEFHRTFFAMAAMLFAFLVLAYAMLWALVNLKEDEESAK